MPCHTRVSRSTLGRHTRYIMLTMLEQDPDASHPRSLASLAEEGPVKAIQIGLRT